MDLDIAELGLELVDGALGTDGQREVHFEELLGGVEVLLAESDVEQTVDDLQVVVDVFEGNERSLELDAHVDGPADVAPASAFADVLWENVLDT